MDQLLLSSLKWDSGRLGLRVDNLPFEVSYSNYFDKGNSQNYCVVSRVMKAELKGYLKCQINRLIGWGSLG